jgi:rRNA-processing protein EBP2
MKKMLTEFSRISTLIEQDVDVVSYIRLHKDNHAAMNRALLTFALPLDKLPFHAHQSITTTESVTIDINDDLQWELAFYKQALHAAVEGRQNLLAEGIPFTRPTDYFAEMVKDDEHMEKVFCQK